MSGRRRGAFLVLIAGLAGCGLRASERATAIDTETVPYGLLDPAAAAVVSEPQGREVELCLLRDDLLVPIARRVDPPVALIDVARAVAEVTDRETEVHLRTSIVAADEITSVERAAGVATVSLAPEASQRLTADPLATVAQLVCTLTRQPGVGLVRFTVGDVPVEVPRADGSLSNGLVSADDYASLLAPS